MMNTARAQPDPLRRIRFWLAVFIIGLVVITFGLIACAGMLPLALIAGHIRGIPLAWRLIDCSFGIFGSAPAPTMQAVDSCSRTARKLIAQALVSGRFLLLRLQVLKQPLDMLLPIQCSEAVSSESPPSKSTSATSASLCASRPIMRDFIRSSDAEFCCLPVVCRASVARLTIRVCGPGRSTARTGCASTLTSDPACAACPLPPADPQAAGKPFMCATPRRRKRYSGIVSTSSRQPWSRPLKESTSCSSSTPVL